LKKPADVCPKEPRTGFQNTKCYASRLCDCSQELSREHVVSKAILEQIAGFDGRVVVRNINWQDGSHGELVGIDALSARVLCQRHNNALSNLDAEMGRFFRTYREFTNWNAPKRNFRIFSGCDIERWLLKTLIGCGAASYWRSVIVPDFVNYLYEEAWPKKCGLYLPESRTGTLRSSASIQLNPIHLFGGGQNIAHGIEVVCAGFPFRLLLPSPFTIVHEGVSLNYSVPPPGGPGHRPTMLLFRDGEKENQIELTWPDGYSGAAIHLHVSDHRRAPPRPRAKGRCRK
jgi:hypothetical protein